MKKIYSIALGLASAFASHAQTASWSALSSGTTALLTGVSATSASICYICGGGGLIRKTSDGGTSWTAQTSGTSQDLYSILFKDTNNGFAVGNGGAALRTTNAGATWTSIAGVPSTEIYRRVWFLDANNGYIVGGVTGSHGTILKTTDGGTTWTNVANPSPNVIYSIFFTSPTTGFAANYNGSVLKTTDGGASWTTLSVATGSLFGNMYFTNSSTGYVVGVNGQVYRTTDGGASWPATVSGTTGDMGGIDFYDAMHGFVVGGNTAANTGEILTTTDGGTTWTSQSTGTARLYNVDMVNANVGYAVGLNGTFMKYMSNVGVMEQSLNKVQNVYPNPFSNTAIIDMGSYTFTADATVELYSISGQLVKSITAGKSSRLMINRDGLEAGVYIYKVLDGQSPIGSGKLTVQ